MMDAISKIVGALALLRKRGTENASLTASVRKASRTTWQDGIVIARVTNGSCSLLGISTICVIARTFFWRRKGSRSRPALSQDEVCAAARTFHDDRTMLASHSTQSGKYFSQLQQDLPDPLGRASPVATHTGRKRNSVALRTTSARGDLDCWNLALFAGGVGCCNRPLEPVLLREYFRPGGVARAQTGAERVRGRIQWGPASATRGRASCDPRSKADCVPRVRLHRIDRADRALWRA
jgi:hypothetical protein